MKRINKSILKSITIFALTVTLGSVPLPGVLYEVEAAENTSAFEHSKSINTVEFIYKDLQYVLPSDVDNNKVKLTDSMVASIDDQEYTGSAIEPEVNVTYNGSVLTMGTDYTVNYTDNTEAGNATATITGTGSYCGTVRRTFEIRKATIAPVVSFTGWTYGDTPNSPSMTYNPSGGSVTYVYYIDSSSMEKTTTGNSGAASEGDVPKNAGTYYVKANVAETANYESGTATKEFTILEKTVDDPLITLSPTTFEYDGNEKEPAVESVWCEDTMILAGEYTVGYSDNINAGTATVTIIDKEGGNYTVSGSTTFTITKAAIHPTITISGWTYGGTSNTPTVGGNIGRGTETIEYKLKDANDSEYSTEVPTDAGEYTVRVTVAESKNYQRGTATADFTIAKATISPSVTIEDWAYGGTQSTPVVTENSGNGAVTYEYKQKDAEDSSYTTTVPTNVDNYTIRATIAESKNYLGNTATDDFNITKGTDPAVVAENIEVQKGGKTIDLKDYISGALGTLSFKFKDENAKEGCTLSDSVLTSGTDEATVVITVTIDESDNCYGKTEDFEVSVVNKLKQKISFASATQTKTYGDEDFTIAATHSVGNGAVSYIVTEGMDVAEVDSDGKVHILKTGTATITATAAETDEYFSASASYKLTVNRKDITVKADDKTMVYGTSEPELTATITGLIGSDTVAYTLSRGAGTAVGTYTITPSGDATQGNYSVTYETGTFTIADKTDPVITKAPAARVGLVLSGQAQALITAGEVTGGTFYYALGNEIEATQPYTTSIPTGTNAGSYYVWYKAFGDANHNDTASTCVEVKISSADKTSLNSAISSAETYYDQIKDNNDYADIASALKSAIDDAKAVSENENALSGTVVSAVTALNTAKSTAETDVKNVDDSNAAKEVTDTINLLPAATEVATTDKEAIEAARKAYDALTADQKKLVDTTTLKKLTDAEAALTAAEESEKAASEKKATDAETALTTAEEAAEKKTKDEEKASEDKKEASEDKKEEVPGNKKSSEWVEGLWYNADGTQTYGYKGAWKTNGTGWWYEDESGWYPVASWQKIDGKWYYFDAAGYMVSNEWIGGYWLSENGAWEYEYVGSWKTNGTDWWYEDESGWYPVAQWQNIDGKWYYFGSDGIMAKNQYIGDYWVGSDGSWQ